MSFMLDKLESIERRYIEIDETLSQPGLTGQELTKLTKERAEIEPLVSKYREYVGLVGQQKDATDMAGGSDAEMRALAKEELESLTPQVASAERELMEMMLPTDPRDERNIFLEIRAGTGGDEAGIFCGDLYRMYCRYAEKQRWKVDVLSSTESEKGGFREIILMIHGHRVYSKLKFESGVHRVQRVPATESQGRIHTSACTVAVLPEVDDIEFEINPVDLEITLCRASGAGGQHINTTDSAVRIVHIPTGVVAECQEERSQHKNKEKALKMLKSRILDKLQAEQKAEISADRKAQVGSGDRSERIRTYNFPQGRLTDHRINLTLYRLDSVMEGDIDEILNALGANHTAELLKMQSQGI
jgi:peptide chain release factor 1